MFRTGKKLHCGRKKEVAVVKAHHIPAFVFISYLFGEVTTNIFAVTLPYTPAIAMSFVFGLYWSVLYGLWIGSAENFNRVGVISFSFASAVGWIAGFWEYWGSNVEKIDRHAVSSQAVAMAVIAITIGFIVHFSPRIYLLLKKLERPSTETAP